MSKIGQIVIKYTLINRVLRLKPEKDNKKDDFVKNLKKVGKNQSLITLNIF